MVADSERPDSNDTVWWKKGYSETRDHGVMLVR